MQSHEKWLVKAKSDLGAAKVLCEANYTVLIAIQNAEKILSFVEDRLEKTAYEL